MRFLSVMVVLLSSLFGRAVAELPDAKKLPSSAALPDPLIMLDGTKVGSKTDWTDKRRPELKKLFDHYMYGAIPPAPKRMDVATSFIDTEAFGGKATLRELEVSFGFGSHVFRVLIATPKGVKSAPCFVGPNFSGNHTLVDDPRVKITPAWLYDRYPGVKNNKATEEGRGKNKDVWNIEQTVSAGYAVATFYNGDIDPDRADVRDGIRPYLPKDLETTTIACWSWGVHRVVDLVSQIDAVDKKRIIAVGHSRLGKTVLLAAATDDRIAATIPHQAGCGGTAPSRGKVGESVKQINDRFPHWFNSRFKHFNDDTSRLPFDQHSLVALCAPRPVLFSNAVEDQWANPDGQFDVLKAADPVYRFLGVDGLASPEKPEVGKLSNGRLAYFIRPGKHSMTAADWKIFVEFAEKNVK